MTPSAGSERDPVDNAQLALLLEVAGTPKPGNVDRHREYPDLRFEHFLAGAVGARSGLVAVRDGAGVGELFEHAVAGMATQRGGNTQFGALLVLTPLLVAASRGEVTPSDAEEVVAETTVEDAAGFYRAFDHVDVAVDDPPESQAVPDVRRGSEAVETLEAEGLTFADVMEASADRDGVAAELVGGFPRSFRVAERLLEDDGPVTDRAATAFLHELAAEPDTFVVTRQDRETAQEVHRRAGEVLDGDEDAEAFADELVERGINPGSTADVVAGGLFVALERGLEV